MSTKQPSHEKTPHGKPGSTEIAATELDKVTGGDGNVGSQSTGAGAGKVPLNPFSITQKIDKSSP